MLYPTELRTAMGLTVIEKPEKIKDANKKGQGQMLAADPQCFWSEYKDSNLGPPGPKPGALPGCATLRLAHDCTAIF